MNPYRNEVNQLTLKSLEKEAAEKQITVEALLKLYFDAIRLNMIRNTLTVFPVGRCNL